MKSTTKQNKIESLAHKFKLVGDPNRLKIICLILNDCDMCVSEIAKNLGLSVAITSHHLQALSKEGLLENSREGKNICYKLKKSDLVLDLKELICKYK